MCHSTPTSYRPSGAHPKLHRDRRIARCERSETCVETVQDDGGHRSDRRTLLQLGLRYWSLLLVGHIQVVPLQISHLVDNGATWHSLHSLAIMTLMRSDLKVQTRRCRQEYNIDSTTAQCRVSDILAGSNRAKQDATLRDPDNDVM